MLNSGETEPAINLETIKTQLLSNLGLDLEPWQKNVLNLVISSLETHGLEGLLSAKNFIVQAAAGDAVDFTGMDLIVASEILAHLQKQEELNKKVIVDYVTQISRILGVVLVTLLKSSISSSF